MMTTMTMRHEGLCRWLGSGSSGGGGSLSLLLADAILLEHAVVGALVSRRLEATMAHLRRGVDELELDLLEGRALGVHQQRFAQRDYATLGTDAATLDHEEILVDLSVERETTHRRDRLVGQIVLGGSAVLDDLCTRDITIPVSSKPVTLNKVISFDAESLLRLNIISPIIWYTQCVHVLY